MGFINESAACIPHSPSDGIDWDTLESLLTETCFSGLKTTQQNPSYHSEGDVDTHTRMVCRELTRTPAFYELREVQRTELFLAAALHDLGKVKTTRLENGEWVSPHHGSTGSRLVREFLWKDCGICGKPDLMNFRETVCALVRHHMVPVRLVGQENAVRKVRETAAIGELAADFSWRMLCMLAEADAKGRIAPDTEEELTRVELARWLGEEAECADAPYHFPDGFVKHAYLSGRNVPPDQTLYDDTWGEVILLCGLPGTGKDTWIRDQIPDLPAVSLDSIREELRIRPTDPQGIVLQTARERARELLRKKQSFVWNATNLTRENRGRLISLAQRYGARVRIVYLETEWEIRADRNSSRTKAVPESAVQKMLEKTVLPTPDEAQSVEWKCV